MGPHASTHASGGADPVSPAAIGAVATNDSRLTDARAPTAHKSSHASGGADALTPAAIGAATYSEGVWTPVLASNAVAGTHTYSHQAGSYVKLGRLVFLLFELQLSTVDQAMSGSLFGVAGLPFVNSAAYGTAHFYLYEGLTAPSAPCTQIVGLINPYEWMVSILWTGSGVAPGQLQTKAGISNTALIYGSAMYRTAT